MPELRSLGNTLLLASLLGLSACGGGGNGGGGGGGGGGGNTVTVSGTVSYEFVPPNAGCFGLNFNATTVRPIRGATVVLLNEAGSELARTTSGDTGTYSFTGVAANTSVRLRVLAEAKRSGTPAWNVEIRDNVDTSATPPALGSRPMYSLDGSAFNTGSSNVVRDLTAETGWGGSSYTGTRAAAPFAILDTIYTSMQFIVAAEPSTVFPPLDAFWSVNNTTNITEFDIDTGALGSSFYVFGLDSLFLVGDASDDTDEFDDHIVAHEWGHYLDDVLFRSDSGGGTHFLGDRLDSRLAWGEGWATALAAMILNKPLYCDTGVPGTNSGFGINAEGGAFGGQGWFDEVSIIRFVYDLWDEANDGADFGSVGFEPIYAVMTGGQRTTPAWANIFTFAIELKALVDANGSALIDALLAAEETVNGPLLDIWGTNEDNFAFAIVDVDPIYFDMVADGSTTNICSNSQFDTRLEKDGNKLSQFRYIRLSVPFADQYNVRIEATTVILPDDPLNDRDQSDPDMFIMQNGVFFPPGGFTSPDENVEAGLTPLLQPGTYIADLRDWRYADPERPATYPSVVCFDVSFTPTP